MLNVLLALVGRSEFAGAQMPWGDLGPIRLSSDPVERAALVWAHIRGGPAVVLYSPKNKPERRIRIEAVSLAAICPDQDGRCSWAAIDLDHASGHGSKGLADPDHAVRCLAERADHAGLSAGLLIARSRGGLGRHVFLFPPAPCRLADAVIAVGALVADAFRIASADQADYGTAHAFRCANGEIAMPGQAGAVEFTPYSTTKPDRGWSIALPGAGTYARRGGGIIIDPFTNAPQSPAIVPRVAEGNWSRFVNEARARFERQHLTNHRPVGVALLGNATGGRGNPLRRIDDRTRSFLSGHAPEGTRNTSCFTSACHLLALGIDPAEALRLILDGAAACELPEREARTAFASAERTVQHRGKR